MDIPQPPPDEETRNIIDRLANFVARNGPEFEMMTKQKQRDNPRFQFLFSGEYYNYYTYRVITEQAILKQQAMRQQQLQDQQIGPPQQQLPLGGNNNMPQQDYHGTQSQFGQGGPSQQPHFAQQPQQVPTQSISPGHAGPRGPHLMQQQRFGSPQLHQQLGPGGGERMNMPPQTYRAQQPQAQFNEFGQSGIPPGMTRGRGPPPHVLQRFAAQQQQRHPSPGSMGENMNVPPQTFHGSQPQFGGQPGLSPGSLEGQPRNLFPPQHRFAGSPQQLRPPQVVTPQIVPINVEALTAQKKILEERAQESEQNLALQHQVLLEQQKSRIEEALDKKHDAEISALAAELNVDITEFDRILEPIMESCTKESISNGKSWIFTHTSTKLHYQLMTLYLLRKTTDPKMTFLERLHIIYLVNDVLHHCMRKGAEDLQLALEAAVIPMFCYAKVVEAQNEENVSKLNKLFGLWESKSSYVSKEAVEKLRNYEQTWADYKNELVTRNAVLVTQVANDIQQTYDGYQAQHQIFTQHVMQNIKQIEQQIQQGILQQQAQLQQLQQQQQMQPVLRNTPEQPSIGGGGLGMMPHWDQEEVVGPTPDQMGNVAIPDLSRPPPGFPPPSDKDLIPGLPYFELPAGLMVPLVKPEDDNYKPLDPKAIRLPPPCAPSEKLLLAVEAFYGPPSHDNPRDSEGWEKLGLYEYYRAKNIARKQKEDDVREGRREKSRSPTPIRRESSPTSRISPPRRRYQSKSPTPTRRRRSRSRSSSPARSRRRRRSRSRSPRRLRRSPTPPSFATAGLGMDRKLDESNKGHQLLKKMGWGGSGLGANEQGIEAPISGGDVREKRDQYKGVGISLNDPFESYRKTKGQAFVDRMRARVGDERP